MRRTGPVALVTLLAALAGAALGSPPPAGAADAPPPGPTGPGEALAGLRSPYLVERREAVERLVALGAAARPSVVAAFAGADPSLRASLVEVLAADGSPEAVDALLAALPSADAATASAIRAGLLRRPSRAAAALEARLAAGGPPPSRLLDLRDLLRRARVEAAFVATKSRSGGTGYYRGQFDSLLPDREGAIPILQAVVADRPVKVPGEHPIGGYRLLVEPPFYVDPLDLRVMAANALAELLRPGDTQAIEEIGDLYRSYLRIARRARRLPAKDRPPESSLVGSVLPILHRVQPGRWDQEVDELLDLYLSMSGVDSLDDYAMLLLRIGRYEAAIGYYTALAGEGFSSYSHYNIACAYATWSLEDPSPRDAARHRLQALRHLEAAVEKGYPDWPWMEQDRDLDPIRGTKRYRALLDRMKADFLPPALPGGSVTPRAGASTAPPAAPPAVPPAPPSAPGLPPRGR